MSRYLTVVYKIEDEEAGKALWGEVRKLIDTDAKAPVSVRAWSDDHTIRRVSLIEKAMGCADAKNVLGDIQAILDCDDPTTFEFS